MDFIQFEIPKTTYSQWLDNLFVQMEDCKKRAGNFKVIRKRIKLSLCNLNKACLSLILRFIDSPESTELADMKPFKNVMKSNDFWWQRMQDEGWWSTYRIKGINYEKVYHGEDEESVKYKDAIKEEIEKHFGMKLIRI
jgi:hypothetical protein